MKIDFEGRTYDLDELGITNKQAEKIREHTGLSVQAWLKSLGDHEAFEWESSFDALYWLMLQQDGQTGTAIADVDYPVYRFMRAYMDARSAEAPAEKEAEPDPTRPQAASARSRKLPSPKSTSQNGGCPDG